MYSCPQAGGPCVLILARLLQHQNLQLFCTQLSSHRIRCLGLLWPPVHTRRGVEKVGVLGFDMGGALSAASAVLVDEIDASVVFYGTPKPEIAKMQGISFIVVPSESRPFQLIYVSAELCCFVTPLLLVF